MTCQLISKSGWENDDNNVDQATTQCFLLLVYPGSTNAIMMQRLYGHVIMCNWYRLQEVQQHCIIGTAIVSSRCCDCVLDSTGSNQDCICPRVHICKLVYNVYSGEDIYTAQAFTLQSYIVIAIQQAAMHAMLYMHTQQVSQVVQAQFDLQTTA